MHTETGEWRRSRGNAWPALASRFLVPSNALAARWSVKFGGTVRFASGGEGPVVAYCPRRLQDALARHYDAASPTAPAPPSATWGGHPTELPVIGCNSGPPGRPHDDLWGF